MQLGKGVEGLLIDSIVVKWNPNANQLIFSGNESDVTILALFIVLNEQIPN